MKQVDGAEPPIHPAAELWPMLNEAELHELAASIAAHGQRLPIIRWRGQIVDGRNRLAACHIAGVEPQFQDRDAAFADDAAVWDFCFDMNQHRRHLSAEQKRQVLEARLRATPERSNRQIAREVHVDHKTVAAQRQSLESTGEIPQLTETVGGDGRSRPARCSRRERTPALLMRTLKELFVIQKRLEKCRARLHQDDIVLLRGQLENIWDILDPHPNPDRSVPFHPDPISLGGQHA